MTDVNKDKEVAPARVSKAELAEIMKQMIAEQTAGSDEKIAAAVEKAVAPLKAQTTDWMEKIKATSNEKDVAAKGTKGIGAGRFVRALAASKGDPARAAAWAKKAWNDDLGNMIVKSLQAGDFTAGGALIPPEIAAEVIDYLRAATVVRAAGARTLPMPRGTLTFRKQTGVATANYVGEVTNITKSEPTVGQITLTAKKLAALVPISNDLLAYDADVSADAFVRDDLVKVLARREDLAFLRGTGLSDTPRGIRYWAPAANINAAQSAWAATTDVEHDLMGMITTLENANVNMTTLVWLLNPRTKNYLRTLRNTNGFLVFPSVNDPMPTIYGKPVFVTTAIPKNLGGGANETEVYLVDMYEVLIGEARSLTIDVDPGASYIENATLVSAFSRDETVMRAIMSHDIGVRYPEAIAITTTVTK